ncbi:MAG: hybrid sensor histidine kinase/response regulator [Bacteroidota bacterium]
MELNKIKVLYIDDEMPNLLGFKASFRLHFTIFIANNSDEAIKILNENNDIHIILCDQRMPGKSGVELLELIRTSFPLPIRMLITGFSDIESVIDAINRGNVYRYIKKPWQQEDIITAIAEGHKFYLANSLLKIKNDELTKAYAELDKFAYSVTHDLRGPITSIAGAVMLIENDRDIESIQKMHVMIKHTVEKLDQFITSVHDYYKIQRGELQIEAIDFRELLDDIKSIYSIAEKVDQINFKTSLIVKDENFRSDYTCLKIVLNNLLSNAFKYQKNDNIEKIVDLSIVVNKEEVKIVVSDNGIGIRPEYIDQIFNLFYRATSESLGSGFGLYNVKDVLKKIDGVITVKSEFNEGTTFEINIHSKK